MISVNSLVFFYFLLTCCLTVSKDNLCIFSLNSLKKQFYWLHRRAFFCLNIKLQSRLWTEVTVKLPLMAQICHFPLVVVWKSWYRTKNTPVLFITVCWLPAGFSMLQFNHFYNCLKSPCSRFDVEFGSAWCDLCASLCVLHGILGFFTF